ncbi:MAG: hypothetical protein JST12_14685 [Armatimonadetes bacterium]|nr:hypothetical protein [Armatimonadota bacterium]
MDKLINLSSDELANLVCTALRKEIFGESWQDSENAWQVWVWRVMPFGSSVIYCQEEATYQRSYQLDSDTMEVTLGDDRTEVEREEVWVPVEMTFSVDDGDFVIKEGPIFEHGHYPDKQASFSKTDVEMIARNSQDGAPLKFEHNDNPILDEDLLKDCGLTYCEARDGTIFGKVRIPKWLDEAYKKKGLVFKVSIGLNNARTKIKELSLCKWPRVENAAVFAQELAASFSAYTASKTDPNADPSPTKKPPTFGTPTKPMKKTALALLFSKLEQSNPELLVECGLSADQLDKVEFSAPKVDLPPQFTAMQNGFVTTKASAFFAEHAAPDEKGVVHATKAMEGDINILYRAALKADGEGGEVKFSQATGMPEEGENVKALRSLLSSFSISTRQGVQAFATGSDGKPKDPLHVDADEIKKDLGVR